ncbi:archease [Haloarchaeobius litoreus]|uniref:Archease n=1 Tax=Haloarchaeobius litoreus TaxID=755306 RepID=A0ABD6DLQ4_9EURY|nr:archease [Haloarchaeobius litoreus]
MSFELREHTADVAVEASGDTLDACFAAVADGLTAAQCDDVPDGVGDRFELSVESERVESLLFDYLDELVYERDVRSVLPADHEAAVTGGDDGTWRVDASARGVPFDAVEAREVKAVTYSEMRVEETADGWHAYVVFDV